MIFKNGSGGAHYDFVGFEMKKGVFVRTYSRQRGGGGKSSARIYSDFVTTIKELMNRYVFFIFYV